MLKVEIIEKDDSAALQEAVNDFIAGLNDSVNVEAVSFTVLPAKGIDEEDWYQAYITYMN
jgi:hypothetical protein